MNFAPLETEMKDLLNLFNQQRTTIDFDAITAWLRAKMAGDA